MRKARKAAAVILAAATAVLMANTTVMAETKAAGPEFSIETDRTEYSSTDPINETVKIYNASDDISTDPINETVKIYNASDDILTDIVISGSIPEGYQTEDGVASPDQWEMKTGDVGSGGTGECTVRLVRKTSGTDQEQGGAQIPGGTDTDRPDKDTDPGNRPDSDGTGDRRYGQYNPVVHRRRRKPLCYHCRSKKAERQAFAFPAACGCNGRHASSGFPDGKSGGTGSRDDGRENRRDCKNDTDRRRGSYFEGSDYIPDGN